VLSIDSEVSVTLDGFDAAAVRRARALASVLTSAADLLEKQASLDVVSGPRLALGAEEDSPLGTEAAPASDVDASSPQRDFTDAEPGFGYPADWPRCDCGKPVLDGHLTCGEVSCDESAARHDQRRKWGA